MSVFSIQIDETTDISAKAHLTATICLDCGNEAVEKFLKFHYVSTGRSAKTLSGIVKGILSKYGNSLKYKLIMQTYDGVLLL